MNAILTKRRALASLCAVAALAVAAPPAGAGTHRAPRDPSSYPAGATRSLILPAHSSRRVVRKAPKKPRKPAKPALKGNPLRALLAFGAMQARYAIPGSALYIGEPFSYLWPYSQALAATVTMANIPKLGVPLGNELHQRLVGLSSYLDTNNSGEPEGVYTSTLPAYDGTIAPPSGPGGPKYYDDNDWVGIELARVYRLDHSPAVLATAEALLRFEIAGWQSAPELGCTGGIPFTNTVENTDRNTVTTAPAAELAVQLYRLTANPEYLSFAEQAYEWVRHCLLQPNGMYADHVDRQGNVEPALWSYNQGSMIGAGALLYQATHNGAFLYQARQTAAAANTYFNLERLESENPFFPSVYFRNVMYLDSITHDPPGSRLAQAYVNNAWQNLRLSGDVFAGGAPPSPQLLSQAAIAQIYALLSSPASTYF
jgi:hypothetical protein